MSDLVLIWKLSEKPLVGRRQFLDARLSFARHSLSLLNNGGGWNKRVRAVILTSHQEQQPAATAARKRDTFFFLGGLGFSFFCGVVSPSRSHSNWATGLVSSSAPSVQEGQSCLIFFFPFFFGYVLHAYIILFFSTSCSIPPLAGGGREKRNTSRSPHRS